jgi:D-alanyl-D-alanine-carboxypeptidase/D-alanyl-D-alanine-endopeptidase
MIKLHRTITSILITCILFLNAKITVGQLSIDSAKFIIKRSVDNGRSLGMVVGIINEKGRQVFGYGKINNNGTKQPDGNTLFEIGSVTKTFTSLVLADMISKGQLKLNDPISKFLPKIVKTPTRNGKEITLADLVTHTSGLPFVPDNVGLQNPSNPYINYTEKQLYNFLSRYTLTRDIGSKYEYSNVGFGLLGHILTIVSGKSYETLVKETICAPLKMTRTVVSITSELQKNLATGYDVNEKAVQYLDFSVLDGCGALRSNVNDLLNYAAANMGLMRTNLDTAIELIHKTHDSNTDALGWGFIENNGKQIYWHNGGTYGCSAYFGFDLKSKTGVVVLSNSVNRIDDIALHILDSKVPVLHMDKVVQVSDTILKTYTGIYKKEDGTTRTIIKKGNNLWFNSYDPNSTPNFRSGKMHFTSNTDFFTYLYPTESSIYLDSLNRVSGLRIKGGNAYAKKVDSLDLSFDGFNGLAWSALEVKDYSNAFFYLQQGLKRDSANLFLLGNLAHTYLFTGNYSKAIEIYKKHIGQNLPNYSSWVGMIISDFKTLKADGLPVEPMNKVLKELDIE